VHHVRVGTEQDVKHRVDFQLDDDDASEQHMEPGQFLHNVGDRGALYRVAVAAHLHVVRS